MQIWHYQADTGLLLGTSTADRSPMEPGVWLIPAFATTAPPPAPDEGHEVAYVDGDWVQRPLLPEPEPEPVPEAPPPGPVTDVAFWQFMLAAASLNIVTLAEAEAAVDTRAMPALFAATLDQLPEPQRTMARIKYKGITRVVRGDDLFALMVAAGIATDEQIDGVFAVAATIT